jgi:hypothetical protein
VRDILTARNIGFPVDDMVPGSGKWRAGAFTARESRRSDSHGVLRDSAIALILAVSPLSFGVDPWLMERRRSLCTTLSVALQPGIGRRVSIVEARQVALRILRAAEQERSRLAQEEANRGVQWEEGA